MKKIKILKRKKGRLVSRVMTAVMVVGLLAVMPLTVSAQTATINLGSLGGADLNNYDTGEPRWTYNAFANLLTLMGTGPYILTGYNSNIAVQAATGPNVTLQNTVFSHPNRSPLEITNATITLIGSNQITAPQNPLVVRENCTVTSSTYGSLTLENTENDAIYVRVDANLSITGSAIINANAQTGARGAMVCMGNNIINVGKTARLNLTAQGSSNQIGIYGPGSFTLNADGIITVKAHGVVIYPTSNGPLTLSGTGSILAINTDSSYAFSPWSHQNILMDDSITLTMVNNDPSYSETHTFEASNTSSTREWALTGDLTTSDPLTNAIITVTLGAGQTGTISRKVGKPGDLNGDDAVNGADMNILLTDFGNSSGFNPDADLNSDGAVNGADMNILLSNFGK